MKTENSEDLTYMPVIDQLDEMIGKSINSLIKLFHKLVKSVIKTNSKMREPLTYNKAVNNLIHKSKQKEAIDKEL